MMFTSFRMKITSDCIIKNSDQPTSSNHNSFCSDQDQAFLFYLNGDRYYNDISQYVIKQNDRILISLGDEKSIPETLEYLESLEIFDVPKKTPQYSGADIYF